MHGFGTINPMPSSLLQELPDQSHSYRLNSSTGAVGVKICTLLQFLHPDLSWGPWGVEPASLTFSHHCPWFIYGCEHSISTTTEWIVVTFGIHIHFPLRINCINLASPL